MKKILCGVVITALLSACSTLEIESEALAEAGFGKTVEVKVEGSDQKVAKTVSDGRFPFAELLRTDLQGLRRANFALEAAYSQAAEKAQNASHYVDGFLIFAAFAIGMNSLPGGASDAVLKEQTLRALGINAGARYANPAQIARAFRLASDEALCFGTKTLMSVKNGKKKDLTWTSSDEDKVRVLSAMRKSHSNLRERLARKPIGFEGMLGKFKKVQDALQAEDTIRRESEIAKLRAQTSDDAKLAALMSCLR